MPAEGGCLRDQRCVLWGRGDGALGLGWERLGVAVGLKKRLKEGWCEELSPLAQSSLLFNNKSHVPSVTRCLFPGQTPQNSANLFSSPLLYHLCWHLSRPHPALHIPRLPGGAGGIPDAHAQDWGSTRLCDLRPGRAWPRAAAASPSALIKTCEMERLARVAPFYLQHLSCC